MTTIWKYGIYPIDNVQTYDMPAGAEIASFGKDANGDLCFWAIVNTDAPMIEKRMWCVGTGWPLDDIGMAQEVAYIGMVVNGPYIWHLIEEVGEHEQ